MTPPKIKQTVVTESTVEIKLDNGISVSVTSNDGYLHLHFCGVNRGQILATPLSHPEDPAAAKNHCVGSNNMNIFYPKPE